MSKIVLEAKDVYKHFTDGKSTVEVIKGLSLKIAAGEFVSIVGASGSGKSTLLHILGGLDQPTQGQVFLNEQRFDNLGERNVASNVTSIWVSFISFIICCQSFLRLKMLPCL